MSNSVKLQDLIDAFDWLSADAGSEHAAYVSRETGKVYWVPEDGALDDEQIPDDIEDGELYVPVPNKRELDLGRKLALRFTEEHLPDAYDRAQLYFSKPGAYGRFKHLLEESGKLDSWNEYEERAVEAALGEWASDNGLHVAGSTGGRA